MKPTRALKVRTKTRRQCSRSLSRYSYVAKCHICIECRKHLDEVLLQWAHSKGINNMAADVFTPVTTLRGMSDTCYNFTGCSMQ